MNLKRWTALAVCCVALATGPLQGCTAMGLTPPSAAAGATARDKFGDSLAAGYSAIAAAADIATSLYRSGKLSEDDARRVEADLNSALGTLKAAQALAATNLPAAQTRLNATLAVLTTLRAFLASKQGVTS